MPMFHWIRIYPASYYKISFISVILGVMNAYRNPMVRCFFPVCNHIVRYYIHSLWYSFVYPLKHFNDTFVTNRLPFIFFHVFEIKYYIFGS